MSVTNSPGTIFGETLCDRIARFIFRLDRGNLPTTLGWKTLWMTVMLSLERWFQEVLVLYLPVDSWVRIPVALVPASLRPRGENCFFCFFCCNCTPLSWKKNESLQSTRPCSHLYCFQARITSVWGGTGELSIKKSQKNSFIRVCICLCINPKKTYSSLFYIH